VRRQLPAVFFWTEIGRKPVRDWLKNLPKNGRNIIGIDNPRNQRFLRMPTSKAAKRKNKHRGSSFESFLKKEGVHELVQATALKRAVALKLHDLMKKNQVNKSGMAAQMRTSRAAVHRLLDPENTSVTLATLNRAARSLGRKIKIELVPA
jgi:antitoxin HicB